MNDNKKPSEPLETEGRGFFHYMRTHKPPWWLYWTPALMSSIILVIETIKILLK